MKFLIITALSWKFNSFTTLRYFSNPSLIKNLLFCFNKILFLNNRDITFFLFWYFFCSIFSFKYFLIIIALLSIAISLIFLLYLIKEYFLIIAFWSLIKINLRSILYIFSNFSSTNSFSCILINFFFSSTNSFSCILINFFFSSSNSFSCILINVLLPESFVDDFDNDIDLIVNLSFLNTLFDLINLL